MKKQTIAIYIVLFLFIFTSITYLFFSTNTIQKDINTNIEKILVSQAGSFAKNIEKEIHSHIKKDPYSELKKDEALRHRMEHAMATIVNEYFQYVYVMFSIEMQTTTFATFLTEVPTKAASTNASMSKKSTGTKSTLQKSLSLSTKTILKTSG